MTPSHKPEWRLSEDWAVTRDPYNWVLMKKTGKSWRKTYYASPQQLLNSLHRKITRTEPAQPDLAAYLETCLGIAQTFSRRFYDLTGMTVQVEIEEPHRFAKPE